MQDEAAKITLNKQRLQRLLASLLRAQQLAVSIFPVPKSLFADDNNEQLILLDALRARFCDLQDYLGQGIFKLITTTDKDEDAGRPLSTRERMQHAKSLP